MSYKYEDYREQICTDDGQRQFLITRDHVHKLLAVSGACTMENAINGVSGDSWQALAAGSYFISKYSDKVG